MDEEGFTPVGKRGKRKPKGPAPKPDDQQSHHQPKGSTFNPSGEIRNPSQGTSAGFKLANAKGQKTTKDRSSTGPPGKRLKSNSSGKSGEHQQGHPGQNQSHWGHTKNLKSYSDAAKSPREWEGMEVRVWKSSNRQYPLDKSEWAQLQHSLMLETFAHLEQYSYQGAGATMGSGMFYDGKNSCGVVKCANRDGIEWIKSKVKTLSDGNCRAWEKGEYNVQTLKLYIPNGFEAFPAGQYVEAVLTYHPDMPDKNWQLVKDYRQRWDKGSQKVEGQRILIVDTTPQSWDYIRETGKEVQAGGGKFQIQGPWAHVKIAKANPQDTTERAVKRGSELLTQTPDLQAKERPSCSTAVQPIFSHTRIVKPATLQFQKVKVSTTEARTETEMDESETLTEQEVDNLLAPDAVHSVSNNSSNIENIVLCVNDSQGGAVSASGPKVPGNDKLNGGVTPTHGYPLSDSDCESLPIAQVRNNKAKICYEQDRKQKAFSKSDKKSMKDKQSPMIKLISSLGQVANVE